MEDIPVEKLVFLDESGINLSMGRSHVWVPKGCEYIDHRPMNWSKNLTLLGAIRLNGWVHQSAQYATTCITGRLFRDLRLSTAPNTSVPGEGSLIDIDTCPRSEPVHRIAIATLALVVVGLIPPTAAAEEPKMPSPKWRSKYGYQKAVWGMSVEDLQKVYPTATEKEDTWSQLNRRSGLRSLELSNQTVAGFDGSVSFIFVSDRLSRCVVHLPCPQSGSCEDRAAAVLRGLDSKYGKRLAAPPGDGSIDYYCFFGRRDPALKASDHVWATEVSVELPKSSDSFPAVWVYYQSMEMPQRGDSSGL